MGNEPQSEAQSANTPLVVQPLAERNDPAWFDSAQLFAGRTEIRLRHRGEEYRLRITRQGKLILTK